MLVVPTEMVYKFKSLTDVRVVNVRDADKIPKDAFDAASAIVDYLNVRYCYQIEFEDNAIVLRKHAVDANGLRYLDELNDIANQTVYVYVGDRIVDGENGVKVPPKMEAAYLLPIGLGVISVGWEYSNDIFPDGVLEGTFSIDAVNPGRVFEVVSFQLAEIADKCNAYALEAAKYLK